jgi:hypothetical protein
MRPTPIQQARYRLRQLEGWRRRLVAPFHVRAVSGPARPALGPADVVAVVLVRDGAAHLEPFLRHHFALGVRHVFLLDNGSTDSTVAQARGFDGVTVLATALPYRSHKYALKRYLVDRFGGRCWCLALDIDELFDFPFSDRISLGGFVRYLDGRGFTAVVAQMLDLFAEGPVSGWPTGMELPARCRWYDPTALVTEPYYPFGNQVSNPAIRFHYGGVRKSAFGVDAFLTKHPLLLRGGGARPSVTSSHYCQRARVADVSCALLHLKFDHGFPHRCREAVRRGSHFGDSQEYRAYVRWLDGEPDPELFSGTCRRLESVGQLVDEGFLAVSDEYLAYVRAAAGD